MAGATHATLEVRKSLWEWLTDHHPEVWDYPDHPALKSPEVLDGAAEYLARRHGGHPSARRPQVLRWLSKPDYFNPFPDGNAIERALLFDWAVINRLSACEVDIFYDLLASMEDPYDQDQEVIDVTNNEVISATPRRYAYLSGTKEQRRMVRVTVEKRRKRSREAVAA